MPLIYIPDEQADKLNKARMGFYDEWIAQSNAVALSITGQAQHGTPLLPMEQAPRDGGTDVLVMPACPRPGWSPLVIRRWDPGQQRWQHGWGSVWMEDEDLLGWLPLPKVAPTQQGT